jgi:hypothetical protein
MPDILLHVDNLRSGVAKNALLALQEVALSFGKIVEGFLDKIFFKLFKKYLDNNEFI